MSTSAAKADVVIGQVAPLSGVLASTGQQMVLGGKVCFDAVNAQGAVHGQKIRTVDDGYQVDETLRLTRDLVADPQVVALCDFAGTFNPWIFHVRAGYADEAEHMVKQLTTQGIQRVAVLYQNDSCAVVREFHKLMKQYAPKAEVNYTNFEECLGAKVLVEALRRAGPHPSRACVIKALETLNPFDLGGVSVAFSKDSLVGSRFVEVTVISSAGKLLK